MLSLIDWFYMIYRKCVVFGKLVNGQEVLKRIEDAGNEEGRPSVTVKIINSGELDNSKKQTDSNI